MPDWVTNAYLILAPIITVWMIIRIIKRRRSERAEPDAGALSQPQSTAADLQVDTLAQQSTPETTAAAETVPETAAAVASGVRTDDVVTSAVSNGEEQAPEIGSLTEVDASQFESAESAASEIPVGLTPSVGAGSSWKDRKLFTSLTPTSYDEGNDLPQIEPEAGPTLDGSGYIFGDITPTLAVMLPESEERAAQTKQDLTHAGYYNPHARTNLKAIRYLGIMVPLLLCGFGLALGPAALELPFMAGLVVLPILGWALPRIFVQNKARDRKGEIESAMPDMLDMLNMCVSQGLTVVHSMAKVGKELKPIYPAMSQELNIVADQANLGTLNQALENLNKRVDVAEVHSFSALMTQTNRMGTSVSLALTEYSDNMRESLKQRADARANQSTFRLLFPTVLCLMPAVFMFLMGPAIVNLSDFFGEGGGSSVLQQGRDAFQEFNEQQNADDAAP